MKKRVLWGPLLAIAALYAVRIGFRVADDLRRYNRMLALSNEEPLSSKMPGLAMQVVREEQPMAGEWLSFLTSVPSDLARYLRMESL